MVDAVEDEVTGTLVPPRGAGALEAAIDAYLNDASLAARHGEAGRARVLRSFSRPQVLEQLRHFYRRVLTKPERVQRAPVRAPAS
ncbi:MAG: hypothetical protein R3B82_10725 [Sandaracinaceae bacterium]